VLGNFDLFIGQPPFQGFRQPDSLIYNGPIFGDEPRLSGDMKN
jgi:hypothetical protein